MERRKLAQAALSQQVRLLDTLTEDVPGQRRSAEPEAQPLLSPPTSPVGRKRLVTGASEAQRFSGIVIKYFEGLTGIPPAAD